MAAAADLDRSPTPPRPPAPRSFRRSGTFLATGIAVLALAACGSGEPTDFDTFIERHKCEKLVLGSDGDIDMSCLDPVTGKRVEIEFEANDRPDQYFTDTNFGGTVWVFGEDEVLDSQTHRKLKKR
jgi:hypothetical protein